MKFAALLFIACSLTPWVHAEANDPPFTPPPNRVGESAWIPLHYQQQETNLCVPTSASIILEYFGDRISPREIKALSLNKQYMPEDSFTDFSTTLFRDLIAGLARRGYRWREKIYPNTERGLNSGLADIERSLDSGIPVMIDTILYDGHAYVVAGYSIPKKSLFIMDPAAPSPGIRAVRFGVLGPVWNSRALGSNERGAVFPQPSRAAPRHGPTETPDPPAQP